MTGTFRQKVDDLALLWRSPQFDDVFAIEAASLIRACARIGLRLSVGMPPGVARANSMVDPEPLRRFLFRWLDLRNGIAWRNCAEHHVGELSAAALTALNYDTGESVTFVEGKAMATGSGRAKGAQYAAHRRAHHGIGGPSPALFSIRIGHEWYGDGGIRLVAPLSPAVHLGADRLLVISTHYEFPAHLQIAEKNGRPPFPGGRVGGDLRAPSSSTSSITMHCRDRADQRPVAEAPAAGSARLARNRDGRHSPLGQLRALANNFEKNLPKTFRYFMRRLAQKRPKNRT